MHVMPILSTLRRHRTAAALIVLEIALTCAIVCNAVFLISDRLARMDRPSGIAEDELVRVQITGIGKAADADALTQQDVAGLRAIPGVKAVAATNMIPFGNSSWNSSISTVRDDPHPPINVATYLGSQDLVETLGVTIIAGRDFQPDEYQTFDVATKDGAKLAGVLITRGVAERMFPDQNAVGKALYIWGDDPSIVVGVIDRLARPNEGRGLRNAMDYAVILPVLAPYTVGGNYVIRTSPERRAEVLAAADSVFHKVSASRIILERQTFAELRRSYYRQDRAMAYLLVGVSVALLIVTALGIVGLASFWVQQRTRQIGIRRALGASRGDILRYFQVENFLLATIGIVLGMALAYAINLWLMQKYQVARLPGSFLPIGAALLWGLGQVAVLGPALRATLISPAIATRSV
jgi:putative ABC transport system permease protein